MIRIRVLILCCFIGVAMAVPIKAAPETPNSLKVVYDPDWAPFEWKDEQGQYQGIISELLAEIERRSGIEFEILETQLWADSVTMVKEGHADMFSAVTVTDERQQYLQFSTHNLYSYPAVILVNFKDPAVYLDFNSDFTGKRIALVKSSGLGEYIRHTYPNLNYVYVDSTQAGAQLLADKQVDAFAINSVTARYLIEKLQKYPLKIALKLDYQYELKLAIRKELPSELMEVLDQALGSISAEEKRQVLNRWMEAKPPIALSLSEAVPIGLLLLLLSVLGWGYLRFLKGEVKERSRSLDQLSQQMKVALEVSELGTYQLNLNEQMAMFDQRLFDIFAVDASQRESEVPMSFFWRFVQGRDLERIQQAVAKVCHAGDVLDEECHLTTAEGHERIVKIRGLCLEAESQQQIIGVIQDITQIKQREAELHHAKEAAEQAMDDLRDKKHKQELLFAIIGHELRTPAASLQMMLLEQNVEGHLANGQDVLASVEHLLDVLDDMRVVIHPEEAVTGNVMSASVAEVLEKTLLLMQRLARESDLEVHLELDANAYQSCLINVQLLRQILLNLIKNVIYHSHASDLWVSAQTRVVDAQTLQAVLSLTDNGIGIDQTLVQTMFESFVRGDNDAEGSGLGLYISRKYAREYFNGDLHYQPNPKGGAVFTLSLSVPLSNQNTMVETPQAQVNFLGLSVLLVEDNEVLRLTMHKLLQREGMVITSVENGAEALKQLEDGYFDMVVTDIFMPKVDGYQLVSRLKQQHFDGLIIGVTAAVVGNETEKLLQLGADAVMSKPIQLQKFAEILSQLRPDWVVHQRVGSMRPQAELLETQQLFDQNAFVQFLDNDLALMHKTLEIFKRLSNDYCVTIEPLLKQGRCKELAQTLHSFKGVAATMFTTKLQAELDVLLQLAIDENIEQIQQQWPECEKLYQQSLNKVEQALQIPSSHNSISDESD